MNDDADYVLGPDEFADDEPRDGGLREQMRATSEANRRLLAERRRDAELMLLARSANWTCPDGEPMNSPGPVLSDQPCSDWCLDGECVGAAHRVMGTWKPDRTNTAWHFSPDRLPGENDAEMTARYTARAQPARRRAMRDHEILSAWAKGTPVASVYCRAQGEDGERCNRRVATVYRHARTYLVADCAHYTYPEARARQLEASLSAREQGDPEGMADAFAAAADVKVWPQVCTLDPRSKDDPLAGPNIGAPFDYLLLGCEHHGNVTVSTAWLRKLGRDGEHADVDPQARRLYALESEVPAED